MYQAFPKENIIVVACSVIFLATTTMQPFLIRDLMDFVVSESEQTLRRGLQIVCVLGAVSLLNIFVLNLMLYFMIKFAISVRSAILSLIFQKSFRLSSVARAALGSGEILTMMSVDVERVWLSCMMWLWLGLSPILFIIAMSILVSEVGFPGLLSGAALLVWMVVQDYISRLVGSDRSKIVKHTDERVKRTNELLQGIRVVKLYAWEDALSSKINAIRDQETALLRRYQMLKMSGSLFMNVGPAILAAVVFLTLTTLHHTFSLTQVYTVLAVLNILRLPLSMYPLARSSYAEASKSFERIQRLLLLSEAQEISGSLRDISSNEEEGVRSVGSSILVDIKHASFDWNLDSSDEVNLTTSSGMDDGVNSSNAFEMRQTRNRLLGKYVSVHSPLQAAEASTKDDMSRTTATNHTPTPQYTLQDITLQVLEGELVAIIGGVGQGKSSLVSAMLGHMYRVSGEQILNAHVAFVSQEHWIQNSTLCSNVLFDDQLDTSRYESVVDSSQLTTDLLSLPSADFTQIGERGINLSGGQKARVSIARALYANRGQTDLYVFDDSLAAVDIHVGKRIFEDAILNKLNGRARIVVMSSNYHLLPHFDKIVVMEHGRAVVCGGYEKLVRKFPKYAVLSDNCDDNDSAGNCAIDKEIQESTVIESFSNPEEEPLIIESSSLSSDTSHSKSVLHGQSAYDVHRSVIESKRTASLSQTSTEQKEDREIGSVSVDVFVRYMAAAFRVPLKHRKSLEQAEATSAVAHDQNFTASDTTYTPVPTSLSDSKGGIVVILIIGLLFTIGQALRVLADLWVGMWARNSDLSDPQHSTRFYLTWYVVIVIGAVFFTILRSYCFMDICVRVSCALHEELLQHVVRAPVNRYFDITPLGRILNRFSTDLDSVDGPLPEFLHYLLQNTFQVISILIVCLASSPYFVIMLVPLGALFACLFSYFRKVSREVKRMNSTTRSPVFSLFTEMLNGVNTLRAYRRQDKLLQLQNERVDTNTSFLFIYWAMSRWLALRLDVLAVAIVVSIASIAVLLTVFGNGKIDPNVLGLAVVNALQMTTLLQWMVRSGIDTENNMTSVERLLAFTKIDPEAPLRSDADPVDAWPFQGSIVFRNVSMRYRPGLNLVLKDLNMSVPAQSKVGIVGRTGSGKSSLMLTLFRMVEPEPGSVISIDGVNIFHLGLHTLRSKLTIIPQDPVMFSGSLRYNLDPFNQFTDAQVWEALERAHMKQEIQDRLQGGLDYQIVEGGENLSAGQRQLLCIARALLRRSRIIVMDEATASVDSFTDGIIQRTIREEFSTSTVLTIAHRLETIADYDWVVVMQNGSVVENGRPLELLGLSSQIHAGAGVVGEFRSLVNGLGPSRMAAFEQAVVKASASKHHHSTSSKP